MKRRWFVATLVVVGVLVMVAVVLFKPRPTYHELIPVLALGQSETEVKSLVTELGLPFSVIDEGLYVGGVSPLNLFRKEHQLVLIFDETGRLSLVYEDIMYRYDDIGSRDVKVGRTTP